MSFTLIPDLESQRCVIFQLGVCNFSGISDLYVHVAVDNEPAKRLYMKSGFIYENDEPAWQARFLDRPRRILLWFGIPGVQL